MYGRTRRRRAGFRYDGKTGKAVRVVMWILTIVCIVIVCLAMAMRTKASQVVAAEAGSAPAHAAIQRESAVDMAYAAARSVSVSGIVAERVRSEAERAIMIDAGHGGVDGGCVFDGVLEKDINRQIAWEVVRKLEERGYRAELVRKGDEDMEKINRAAYANRNNALLYVSIHQNSCEYGDVSGIETWYGVNRAAAESRKLAQCIQRETVSATGADAREMIEDRELCVINKSHMPSCLIETGFLSNREERGKLCTAQYREQVAEGIVRGIERYLHDGGM